MFSATFSAELGSLTEIQEFVRQGASGAEFSAEDLNRLDLVVEEIAVNVCRYAYTGEGMRPLRIDCEVERRGEIHVWVADCGIPFDPRAHPSPDLDAKLKNRPVGGLGIFLVAHFAQAISYERSDGWNRLSFQFSARRFSVNAGAK